jgi:hypothetical protein
MEIPLHSHGKLISGGTDLSSHDPGRRKKLLEISLFRGIPGAMAKYTVRMVMSGRDGFDRVTIYPDILDFAYIGLDLGRYILLVILVLVDFHVEVKGIFT